MATSSWEAAEMVRTQIDDPGGHPDAGAYWIEDLEDGPQDAASFKMTNTEDGSSFRVSVYPVP